MAITCRILTFYLKNMHLKKKFNKQEWKFQQKPWITKGLQVSIKKKNSIFRRFIRRQNRILKKDLHLQYKNKRNLLSTLLKYSKQTYFFSYFKDNIKDVKKTWKGIKSIISMKCKNNDIPSSILNDGKCITESTTIANIFNDFFHSVAPPIQPKLNFFCKSSNEYLPSKNYYSFIITSTSKAEIDAIISSLNKNKSTGPNSIPFKTLKLT